MSAFPSSPDAVAPEWLNSVLTGTDFAHLAPVKHVAWEPIGTGQVGDSVRFTLQYADPSREPATLAAKFPAADPVSRGTAAMLGLYAKEVQFYTQIAQHLSARLPKVAFANIDEAGAEFILLFEDLGPARGGNQLSECSIEDARAAICQAAAIHGPSWHNPTAIGADWLHATEELTAKINMLYPQAQSVFLDRYAASLEPEYMALCEAIVVLPDLSAARLSERQCLVHGDFRLDNMLFDIRGGAEPIAVLDWQTVTAGQAMTDIGYFMGTGIGDRMRRTHEDELLDLYLAEMAKYSVNLTRADIARDYRIGALHGLTTAVFSAAFVERTERGDENFLSMARGACALALEHNSLGAIEEGA